MDRKQVAKLLELGGEVGLRNGAGAYVSHIRGNVQP